MMAKNKNMLAVGHCNKAMCKSCIFRTDGNQVTLSNARMKEINKYLTDFSSSHECHVTKLTCYGGLVVTAQAMFEQGIIPDNKVDTMLMIARAFLGLEQDRSK